MEEHPGQSSEAKLLAELAHAPEVDVIGVIPAVGVSGGQSQGETDWRLLFAFNVWRSNGGPVQKRRLVLRCRVSRKDLDTAMKTFKPYDVVRVRARVAEKNCFDSPQGLIVRIRGKNNADAELNEAARRLQEPVTFTDKQFGTFALDRRVDTYEAATMWGSRGVRLSIPGENERDTREALSHAATLWRDQASWMERVLTHAVRGLLDLKNESWSDEGEEVKAAEFRGRMTLESISVDADGGFEFWFDDGDLFAGHWIMVYGSLKDGTTGAEICG